MTTTDVVKVLRVLRERYAGLAHLAQERGLLDELNRRTNEWKALEVAVRQMEAVERNERLRAAIVESGRRHKAEDPVTKFLRENKGRDDER